MLWRSVLKRWRLVLPATIGITVLAGLGVAAVSGAGSYPAGLTAAARNFETAIGGGGSGVRFDVVQVQTEDALPGGPDVPIVDPSDSSRVVGTASHVLVNTVLARGQLAPGGGFWMDMRLGSGADGEAPSYDNATPLWSVIYQGGTVWRNDGYGWYRTGTSPGIGLDPGTELKLGAAVRGLSGISDLGNAALAGVTVHHYRASVDVANFPGVIASDGATFTETPFPLDVWIDGSNRLVQLEAQARNTNEANYRLQVDTRITFSWTPIDGAPQPVPTAQLPLHPAP